MTKRKSKSDASSFCRMSFSEDFCFRTDVIDRISLENSASPIETDDHLPPPWRVIMTCGLLLHLWVENTVRQLLVPWHQRDRIVAVSLHKGQFWRRRHILCLFFFSIKSDIGLHTSFSGGLGFVRRSTKQISTSKGRHWPTNLILIFGIFNLPFWSRYQLGLLATPENNHRHSSDGLPTASNETLVDWLVSASPYIQVGPVRVAVDHWIFIGEYRFGRYP